MTWLNLYRSRPPGVEVGKNVSTALDGSGEPQPDTLLPIAPDFGGQTHNAGNFIGGAPELVIEVAETSRNIDLGNKLSDYQRAGVLEYVVVASDPDEVIWHVRRADRFLRVPPDADGVYRSQVFPGLWLDPQVLLADDVAALVAAFEKGLASAEHAAFVARLAAARGSV